MISDRVYGKLMRDSCTVASVSMKQQIWQKMRLLKSRKLVNAKLLKSLDIVSTINNATHMVKYRIVNNAFVNPVPLG